MTLFYLLFWSLSVCFRKLSVYIDNDSMDQITILTSIKQNKADS